MNLTEVGGSVLMVPQSAASASPTHQRPIHVNDMGSARVVNKPAAARTGDCLNQIAHIARQVSMKSFTMTCFLCLL